MKIYHVKGKAPMARPGKKYIDHERYWGSIVVFAESQSWYCFAVLFSPCGTKRHQLNETTFEMLSKGGEHIHEGMSSAEYRHFNRVVNRAEDNDLRYMKTCIDMKLIRNSVKTQDDNFEKLNDCCKWHIRKGCVTSGPKLINFWYCPQCGTNLKEYPR